MNAKQFLMSLIGIILLVSGIALLLHFWEQLTIVFQGGIGFILALAGLLILYSIKGK